MPTDLPPDYKPKPSHDPADPADAAVPGGAPGYPPEQGEDSRDPSGSTVGPGGDVVDPTGWRRPPLLPGIEPADVPSPAGTPTF